VNFKQAAGGLVIALIVVPLAVVGVTGLTQRERVVGFNVSSPTSCISGIVYFIDKGSKQVITPVIDDKTDKPQHCK